MRRLVDVLVLSRLRLRLAFFSDILLDYVDIVEVLQLLIAVITRVLGERLDLGRHHVDGCLPQKCGCVLVRTALGVLGRLVLVLAKAYPVLLKDWLIRGVALVGREGVPADVLGVLMV